MCVLKPAVFPLCCLSNPIIPPRITAVISLISIVASSIIISFLSRQLPVPYGTKVKAVRKTVPYLKQLLSQASEVSTADATEASISSMDTSPAVIGTMITTSSPD
jgi:hypothetical protein